MPFAPWLVLLSVWTAAPADNSAQFDVEKIETEAEQALKALPGNAACVFTEIGEVGPKRLCGVRAEERFAIGSSFKLYILGTLIDEVNAGRRQIDDTMRLRAELKGPPHSEMGGWPIDSPVTLHTLALKMISVSDNTATDHLHHLLGREQIERRMPLMGHGDSAVNRPLLSTREMTQLRDKKQGIPAQVYRKLDEAGRRAFLAEMTRGLPDYDKLDFDTAAYDLSEWYASPVEMSRALTWIFHHTVPDRPAAPLRAILTIDPKLDYDRNVWNFVGFKGGSEKQVLAGNWLMQHRDGRWYTFHVYWNNPDQPVSPEKLLAAIKKILTAIEAELAVK